MKRLPCWMSSHAVATLAKTFLFFLLPIFFSFFTSLHDCMSICCFERLSVVLLLFLCPCVATYAHVCRGAGIDLDDLVVSDTSVGNKVRAAQPAPSAITRQSANSWRSDMQESGSQLPPPQQQEHAEKCNRMERLEIENAQLQSQITQMQSKISRLHADNEQLRSILELPQPSEGGPPM